MKHVMLQSDLTAQLIENLSPMQITAVIISYSVGVIGLW